MMNAFSKLAIAGLAAAAMLTAGCADTSQAMDKQPMDIVDTAQGAGQFNTLVAAVGAAGLADTLKSPGPFTVFAPTDDAFATALEALGLTDRKSVV